MHGEIGTDILKAKELLQAGELAGIPTETVYGLAANALNENAVLKIYQAKGRPSFDPLIVHCASPEQAFNYASSFPPVAKKLAEAFWPGPLTLVLPRKEIIPDIVTSGLDTVGIRVPSHPLTLKLLQSLDFPLAAPSANPFGYVSPTTAQHVVDQLGDKIAYVLDGGPCEVGLESTIIGFEGEVPVIYRLGGLDIEKIRSVAGIVQFKLNQSSNPQAPGQLNMHYAPGKKMAVFSRYQLMHMSFHTQTAYLLYNEGLPHIASRNTFILSPGNSTEEAAKNLFSILRKLDQLPYQEIIAEWAPEEGLGKAINDRLKRASA